VAPTGQISVKFWLGNVCKKFVAKIQISLKLGISPEDLSRFHCCGRH